MNVTISFKNLEHTPALDERIHEKSAKIKAHVKGNPTLDWVCGIEEGQHMAEVKVHGPNYQFFAKASSESMYKSIQMVTDKIERQIEKSRESKLHRGPIDGLLEATL